MAAGSIQATERHARGVAVVLAIAAAAVLLAAALYHESLIFRLARRRIADEATLQAMLGARALLALLGITLLLGACAMWRLRPRGRRLGRPILGLAVIAGVTFVVPLLVLEIAGRPFVVPKTTIFVPDRELGWRLRAGARDRWLGASVQINAKGLRGPELPYARTTEAIRLLYLGDSVTFGAGVSEPASTYPYAVAEQLRQAGLGEIETVNAAVGGYSPWQQRRYLEREGARYAPDVVVIGFVLNDVLEEAFLSRTGYLPERYQLRRTATSPLDRLASHSGLARIATGIGRRLLADPELDAATAETGGVTLRALVDGSGDPAVGQAWNTTLRALDALIDACRERSFDVVLIVFPLRFQLEAPRARDTPQRVLRDHADGRGVPLIDLLEPLAASDGAYALFLDEVHLSAAGHRRVAEIVARFILERGIAARPER